MARAVPGCWKSITSTTRKAVVGMLSYEEQSTARMLDLTPTVYWTLA
jgi:hypothetical protein